VSLVRAYRHARLRAGAICVRTRPITGTHDMHACAWRLGKSSLYTNMEYPAITFTCNLPITYSTWLPTSGLNNIVIRSGQTITLHGKSALYALRYVLGQSLEVTFEYVYPPAPPTPPGPPTPPAPPTPPGPDGFSSGFDDSFLHDYIPS
jgi:hypothetical protein